MAVPYGANSVIALFPGNGIANVAMNGGSSFAKPEMKCQMFILFYAPFPR